MRSYGISVSTLEEIFLKVGHLDDPLSIWRAPILAVDELTGQSADTEKVVLEKQSFKSHTDKEKRDHSLSSNLQASLLKRYWTYRHNKKSIFTETVYPAAVMIYGVLLTQFIYT